jgi:hypothetical protein
MNEQRKPGAIITPNHVIHREGTGTFDPGQPGLVISNTGKGNHVLTERGVEKLSEQELADCEEVAEAPEPTDDEPEPEQEPDDPT